MENDVVRVYKMMQPKPKPLLQNPDRWLVREGPIVQWSEKQRKKKGRYFFLFNDALLIANQKARKKFILRIYINLSSGITVQDVPDSSNDPPDVEFRVYARKKTLVFFGSSKKHKNAWISDIDDALNGRFDDNKGSREKKTSSGRQAVPRARQSRDDDYDDRHENGDDGYRERRGNDERRRKPISQSSPSGARRADPPSRQMSSSPSSQDHYYGSGSGDYYDPQYYQPQQQQQQQQYQQQYQQPQQYQYQPQQYSPQQQQQQYHYQSPQQQQQYQDSGEFAYTSTGVSRPAYSEKPLVRGAAAGGGYGDFRPIHPQQREASTPDGRIRRAKQDVDDPYADIDESSRRHSDRGVSNKGDHYDDDPRSYRRPSSPRSSPESFERRKTSQAGEKGKKLAKNALEGFKKQKAKISKFIDDEIKSREGGGRQDYPDDDDYDDAGGYSDEEWGSDEGLGLTVGETRFY